MHPTPHPRQPADDDSQSAGLSPWAPAPPALAGSELVRTAPPPWVSAGTAVLTRPSAPAEADSKDEAVTDTHAEDEAAAATDTTADTDEAGTDAEGDEDADDADDEADADAADDADDADDEDGDESADAEGEADAAGDGDEEQAARDADASTDGDDEDDRAEEDEDAEAALDAEATTDAADAGGDPAAEAVVEPDAPLVDTETVDPPDEAVPDAHHLVETAGAPQPVDEAAVADQITAAPTRADLGVAGDETAAAGPLRPGDVAETPIAVWDQRAAQESWPSNGQWPRLRIPPAG